MWRGLLVGLVLATIAGASQARAAQSMTLLGVGAPSAAPAGYTGPGDVQTFVHWIGLRAYSTADRGNALVNVCNSTGGVDVLCQDFSSDPTTGALVISTIGGVSCSTAPCTIKTWYDRIGGNNCTEATIANRATLTVSYQHSLPAGVMLKSSDQGCAWVSTITQAKPYAWSGVIYPTTVASTFFTIIGNSGRFNFGISSGNFVGSNGLTSFTLGATVNTEYAVQVNADTSTALLNLNGTESGNITMNIDALSASQIYFGLGLNGSGNPYDGAMMEMGQVAGDISSGNRTALYANQHTYWGF